MIHIFTYAHTPPPAPALVTVYIRSDERIIDEPTAQQYAQEKAVTVRKLHLIGYSAVPDGYLNEKDYEIINLYNHETQSS